MTEKTKVQRLEEQLVLRAEAYQTAIDEKCEALRDRLEMQNKIELLKKIFPDNEPIQAAIEGLFKKQ